MRVDEFDYELPEAAIAQHPAHERDGSRMLRMDRATGALTDDWFRHLPQVLRPGDLLVMNNTRVFPARLFGHRRGVHAQPAPSPRNRASRDFLEGRVEVLLVRRLNTAMWEALVRPGRKLPVGEHIDFADVDGAVHLSAEILARGEFGERQLLFHWEGDFFAAVERLGHMPLPPYIHRPHGAPDQAEDRERYQTVFAREPGSVAAPTAGLHFTPEVFRALEERGVERVEVTLEVGLGTFQPVHVEEVERHAMHAEHYRVGLEAAAAVTRAKAEKRRVIAVGTTAARTLEAVAGNHDGRVEPEEGDTRLFIYPGKSFQVLDGLLTNFHAPRSTLLMLVAAFAGREAMLNAYRHALAHQYRFLSYGDCMLIV